MSCFSGDVVLKDLKLKAEALNSLKLPVAVKSGFVGTITLKVAIFFFSWWNFDDFQTIVTISFLNVSLLELGLWILTGKREDIPLIDDIAINVCMCDTLLVKMFFDRGKSHII